MKAPSVDGRRERVLLVSSVVPRPTAGGELLLQRHLIGEQRIELALIAEGRTEGIEPSFTAVKNTLVRRLRPARWRQHLQVIQSTMGKLFPMAPMVQFAQEFKPDVVLTVTHGHLFPYAAKLAERLNRPLVSIYHDWWPALVPASRAKSEERHFRDVYMKSRTVFSVSAEMLQLLGPHRDARVLLPIPGEERHVHRPVERHQPPFKLLYVGRLNHPYQAVQDLALSLRDNDRLKLVLFGDASQWDATVIADLSVSGVYRGVCPPGDRQIEEATQDADALLTHISFDPADALRARTSFPSKMTDYFRYGKPVVLWAPEYSAAARWLRSNEAGLLITDPSPAALIAAVEHLAGDFQLERYLRARAETLSKSTVCRSTIQAEFIDGLATVHREATASRRASGIRIANG